NIMGTTPCIEPNYKNLYVKSNLSGDFIVLNAELVKDLKLTGLWGQEMLDQLKYFDGELDAIDDIPAALKLKHKTVFGIGHEYIIDAAARRQKWLDQSQASNIEKATIDVKKELRGLAAAGVKREFTPEEQNACSLDAMINGGTCEACQ
ncbi:ribonucleoside-diphosphate reductase subunit alpha, partial [bacterium]|nr:ribonucleoside-diphosphate reductase subunit alpha [bacterium]